MAKPVQSLFERYKDARRHAGRSQHPMNGANLAVWLTPLDGANDQRSSSAMILKPPNCVSRGASCRELALSPSETPCAPLRAVRAIRNLAYCDQQPMIRKIDRWAKQTFVRSLSIGVLAFFSILSVSAGNIPLHVETNVTGKILDHKGDLFIDLGSTGVALLSTSIAEEARLKKAAATGEAVTLRGRLNKMDGRGRMKYDTELIFLTN